MDVSTEKPAEKVPFPKQILTLFTDWITTAEPGICIAMVLLVGGIGMLLLTFVVGSLDQVLLQKANPAAFEDHPQPQAAHPQAAQAIHHGPASFNFGHSSHPQQYAAPATIVQTQFQPAPIANFEQSPTAFGQPHQSVSAYPAMFGQPRYDVQNQSAGLWRPFRNAEAEASTQFTH